jgi:hypothetical protein
MATYSSRPEWLRKTAEYEPKHKRHDEKESDAIAWTSLTL